MRKPMMRRKGGPEVIIAFGAPKMDKMAADKREMPDEEMSENEDTLTCPKCGAELADTEENRAYVNQRDEEMDEDDENEDEV